MLRRRAVAVAVAVAQALRAPRPSLTFHFQLAHPTLVKHGHASERGERARSAIRNYRDSLHPLRKNLRKSSGIQTHVKSGFLTHRATAYLIVLRNCEIARLKIHDNETHVFLWIPTRTIYFFIFNNVKKNVEI